MKKNIWGFTLVELLTVMTILVILSAMWTIYLFWNFQNSRDSVRVTDLWIIASGLDAYFTTNSGYPSPDNFQNITYSGITVWSQWEFWSWVAKKMKIFWSNMIQDPKFKNYYTYSTTNKWNEYQLASIYEWIDEEEGIWELSQMLIPQAHASIPTAYVIWDFNGFMVRVSTGSTDTFIAAPSIITTDFNSTNVVDIISWMKLVYNEFYNLPETYSGHLLLDGGFNFNVSDPIIFSGPKSDLYTQDWLNSFANKLSYIYATTPTESFDKFRLLLESKNKEHTTKNFLAKNFKMNFEGYFDCRDIYDSWDIYSGEYKIDPDWNGPKWIETVYCDMDTGWWGWTKRGLADITNWDFNNWNHISSMIENSGTSIVNLGLWNTPVASGYAIRQNTPSSYYKIWIEDQLSQITEIETGDEIRMTLWIRDDSDMSANTWLSCLSDQCVNNPSAWYAFHNVFYWNDGLNIINWYAETIDTHTTADGKIWKKQLLRKRVSRDLDDFEWWIGQGFWASIDIYITWVDIEIYYGGYEVYE